jgi:hypothetical protein
VLFLGTQVRLKDGRVGKVIASGHGFFDVRMGTGQVLKGTEAHIWEAGRRGERKGRGVAELISQHSTQW